MVVSGKGLMTLDDREFEVGPGHVIVNRPGGTHGLKNIGAEELRIVVIEVESRSEWWSDAGTSSSSFAAARPRHAEHLIPAQPK